MTDLPYTYTDEDDVALRVDRGVCTAYDRPGRASVSFYAPKGKDAIALARAVLAAAGDTGHEVVEVASVSHAIRSAEEEGARSMRDRAAVAATDNTTDDYDIRRKIRALPLLDSDATEGTRAAPVHVATPEGITPCGEGHPDVTVSAFIPEVSCVECLRAIALEKGGQSIRYRTAWESARRGRTQARAQLADARRYVRILGEQRADLRKQVSAAETRLPEDDMVEPDDQATSLESRVEALEQQYTDLANLAHGHSEDLARLHRRFTAQDDG